MEVDIHAFALKRGCSLYVPSSLDMMDDVSIQSAKCLQSKQLKIASFFQAIVVLHQ